MGQGGAKPDNAAAFPVPPLCHVAIAQSRLDTGPTSRLFLQDELICEVVECVPLLLRSALQNTRSILDLPIHVKQ